MMKFGTLLVLNAQLFNTHKLLATYSPSKLVIDEIWNNASAIFQNFVSICCKIEFVQLW
jgi:hypothetical protein